MCGFSGDGKWFQHCCVHGAPAAKSQDAKRLSLTFRLTAQTALKTNFKPNVEKAIDVMFQEQFHDVSFDDMYSEIKSALIPDVTKMFGKVYENKGRMSGEFLSAEFWPDASQFVYTYGRVKHPGNKMGPIMQSLCGKITKVFGQQVDWVHATYYPCGESKLKAHSDDEECIAYGSDIFALTFLKDATKSRQIVVGPKPKKRKLETE